MREREIGVVGNHQRHRRLGPDLLGDVADVGAVPIRNRLRLRRHSSLSRFSSVRHAVAVSERLPRVRRASTVAARVVGSTIDSVAVSSSQNSSAALAAAVAEAPPHRG